MMADAHRRRFDIVAVWKFDRFARSVSHLLRALETFRSLGIEFVSLSEQVDTSTPTGKNGVHSVGRGRGARTFIDRRKSESRTPECPSQRQAVGQTTIARTLCSAAEAAKAG
jgi:DNA invertase Pin-like site-specific DNA recombinase